MNNNIINYKDLNDIINDLFILKNKNSNICIDFDLFAIENGLIYKKSIFSEELMDNIIIHNYFNYKFNNYKGISIIIPVYKGQRYIKNIFLTLEKQTLDPSFYEAIFIVNGETDNNLTLILKYACSASFPVKVLQIHKKSLPIARNIGITFSFKEYFCFLDVDDEIESNYLLDAYNIIDKDHVVITNMLRREAGVLSIDNYGKKILALLLDKSINYYCHLFTNNAAKIVPRHMLSGLTFNSDLKSGEDIVFWINFLLKNKFKIITSYYPGGSNSYIRNVTKNSVSRQGLSYEFNVIQRKKVIELLNKIYCFDEVSINIIKSISLGQCIFIVEYLLKNNIRFQEVLEICKNLKPYLVEFIIRKYLYKYEKNDSFVDNKYLVEYYISAIYSLSSNIFETDSVIKKRSCLNSIKESTLKLLEVYGSLSTNDKILINNKIKKINIPFFNKSKFGDIKGIAFCHNFPPDSDPSANVAVKRLSQISVLQRKIIKWTCYRANMPKRPQDLDFYDFFACFQCDEIKTVDYKASWNINSQIEWGKHAYKMAANDHADVMYSRSLWIGSHLAALRYKKSHPNVYWFAEFSDPLHIDIDNNHRLSIQDHDRKYRGDFYSWLESEVMMKADKIIFLNRNQKKFMIQNNNFIKNKNIIFNKSISVISPGINKEYYNLFNYIYDLDNNYINIAYFGSIYKNRNLNNIISLLRVNPKIKFHIFMLMEGKFEIPEDIVNRVIINKSVGYFQFLNLSKKFDYLYLEDTQFSGNINPYLPSKFIDYILSGSKIILLKQKNSILSRLHSDRIIDFNDFMNSLNVNI